MKKPATMQFKFKESMLRYYGEHRGLDAQKVGDALSRIGNGNVYAAKPADIVAAARPKTSALHNAFDWEDSVAANRWRLAQARGLVASVVTVRINPLGEEVETRAFVSVKGRESFAYQRIDQIFGDEHVRIQVLRRALDDLRAFRNRYQVLEDLLGPLKQLEGALDAELGRFVDPAA